MMLRRLWLVATLLPALASGFAPQQALSHRALPLRSTLGDALLSASTTPPELSTPSLPELAHFDAAAPSLARFDAAAPSLAAFDSTLSLASFQDLRDGVADVVRPLAFLAALPAFGLALIPLTIATAVARRVRDADVADVAKSIPADAWTKLAFCVLVDAVGDGSSALPGGAHGLVEALLGPVDFLLLRTFFADSAVVPALGLLEEWLPFLPETAPIATIAWCVETLLPTSGLAKLLGLEKK
jgi:hypothetical protein